MEPVAIHSADERLQGIWEAPEVELVGAVVLVHGWSGCRVGPHRILVEAARHLNSLGLATLRFDLSGRGESTGEPLTVDLDTMIADTSAAVNAAKERFPGLRVAILGMCSGGNVGLAAACRGDVPAVAAWSTYPFQGQRRRGQDVRRTTHFLVVYLRKAFRAETWLKLFRGCVNFRMIWKVLFRRSDRERDEGPNLHRSQRDVIGPLSRYGGRMLFMYGGSDPEAVDARRVFGEFCSEHGLAADFDEVEGANHNFYSLPWKRSVIERTGRWLVAALSG